MQTMNIKTHRRNEMLDITDEINSVIRDARIESGLAVVYVPHTTAGVTINENADPSVVHDILLTLEELIPQRRSGYRHGEGNSDSHVKSSLVGPSVTVIIENGRLCLGTWQSVYFCEFDGPRNRKCIVKLVHT
ncbi:MAG: YjbQ family protein [Sedimentisphaerales bacterium]|nr:YjbQ family protein [Sedimentisphaerales bacterium]